MNKRGRSQSKLGKLIPVAVLNFVIEKDLITTASQNKIPIILREIGFVNLCFENKILKELLVLYNIVMLT